MTRRNETVVTLIAALITGGILLTGGYWFLTQNQLQKTRLEEAGQPENTAQEDRNEIQTEFNVRNIPRKFEQLRDVPIGTFNYGGSTTWAPIRRESVAPSPERREPRKGRAPGKKQLLID